MNGLQAQCALFAIGGGLLVTWALAHIDSPYTDKGRRNMKILFITGLTFAAPFIARLFATAVLG